MESVERSNALAKQVPSQPSCTRTAGAAFDFRAFAVVRKLRNIIVILYCVRTVSSLLASEPSCVKPSRASSLVRNSLWAAWQSCVKTDALWRSVRRPVRTPHELWRRLSDHPALGPSLLAGISPRERRPNSVLVLVNAAASYAMHRAGAMVLVNVMRIPCFGRSMTIGRGSMVWPGVS
jgi:hypothetical protein